MALLGKVKYQHRGLLGEATLDLRNSGVLGKLLPAGVRRESEGQKDKDQ